VLDVLDVLDVMDVMDALDCEGWMGGWMDGNSIDPLLPSRAAPQK
jgi:hypothetical protein